MILRIARFIPTILDDVFTATRAAFVRHGYLNHAADYGSSLTFSHHPEDKFAILERHGFVITRQQVLEALARPDRVLPGSKGRSVAERALSAHHLVRVVYVMHNDDVGVITFYPARAKGAL